jgi:hypothetical protein
MGTGVARKAGNLINLAFEHGKWRAKENRRMELIETREKRDDLIILDAVSKSQLLYIHVKQACETDRYGIR